MNSFDGYLISTTKYKDYDLICELLTEKGLITFINRGALKSNSKLNCNVYKLCFINVELYKGNQRYFMIRDVKLIKSINLNNANYENMSFYNFICEITLILCKNESFDLNLYEDFKNTIDSINLNVQKFYYVLSYFIYILNNSGVIKINFNDFKGTKENLLAFFEYNKLNDFIKYIDDSTIKYLLLEYKEISKEMFKKCFFILTLIYESSFNQKLNSSQLIYII